ncbi:MAG: hypothetical protein R3D60_11540 [Paracoccaceae bacterium]
MKFLSRLRRLVLRSILGALVLAALAAGSLAAAIANPAPFFAHRLTVGQITLLSAAPIPDAAADYLSTVDLIPRAAMPAFDGPVSVVILGEGWRQSLFMALTPGAGGVTYIGLNADTVFLSGADWATGLLVKDGRSIPPPRDLAYYLRHEISHLATGQLLGAVRFHQRPRWVIEGSADLAALGAPDRQRLRSVVTALEGRVVWNNWGFYARERLLVDWAIATHGPEFLWTTDWTDAEAWAQFTAANG